MFINRSFIKVIKIFFIVVFISFLLLICPISPISKFYKSYVVRSGSMEPSIKSASLAIVKTTNPQVLKVGDVIAFTSPNNPRDTILHRIKNIKSLNPPRFTTGGDRNNTPDQWDVVGVGVKGKYIFSIPLLGGIVSYIQTPFGFILFICFPALIIVYFEIKKIINVYRQEVKHRRRTKPKKYHSKILFLLIFVILLLSKNPKNIFARYSSTVFSTGIDFSLAELSPPESVLNLNDVHTINIPNFNINVNATDNVSVKEIKLYYSYNFNEWQQYSEIIYSSSGDFHFNFSDGDGLYSFESISIDSFGNVEDKSFDYFNNQIKVDTHSPTTNLNNQFPLRSYSGQNYLINGDFNNGSESWVPISSVGDHHVISVGDSKNAFILGSEKKSINNTDSVMQVVSIPASASATLSFSYRFFSHDIADYDYFDVNITDLSGTNILESILKYGNLNSDNYEYDSGWINISRSLDNLAGQAFKLIFNLVDTGVGDSYNSWVYLNDVKISTLDIRIGETKFTDFLATDLSSEIASTTPPTLLHYGENILSFSSTDSAENSENIQHQSIFVASPVVINSVNKNTLSLFNNNLDQSINLENYSYTVNGSTPIYISGNILPHQSFDIVLVSPFSDSSQINLYDNTNNLSDSVTLTELNNFSWQRLSDGLGPWIKNSPPLSFNLESRLSVSKITLTVTGLASTLSDMSYTIDFTDISGPQQIFGQILSNTIDSSGSSSRDFYLGTCSSGGTCLPAKGIGGSFVVTFSNLPPKTFIFD